jgi:hypothetical protein
MFLNDALAVIGIFLLGAGAGGCLKYARYRGLVALCNQLLAERKSLHAGDGALIGVHFGRSPVAEGTTSPMARIEQSISSGAESPIKEIADFKLQRDGMWCSSSRFRD